MVIPVLQFGWKSKQAIIVSVILIAISDSNLFAVVEFLEFPHKLENIKISIFCLGRYTTDLKKMNASVEAATC